MSQWVQHISGQGEKWEVRDTAYNTSDSLHTDWQVMSKDGMSHFLPKSEYTPCDPPERWVDVTAECEIDPIGEDIRHKGKPTIRYHGYRLRKVPVNRVGPSYKDGYQPGWAFIVEKRR